MPDPLTPLAPFQKVRYGDRPAAHAAVAYYRERGWKHIDSPDHDHDTDEIQTRVFSFCSGYEARDAEVAQLTADLRDAREQVEFWKAAATPSDAPQDAQGKGRLLLNAYGRCCYEAGREAAESQAQALTRERDEAKQQIADAWWILGHPYADRYSSLSEALKDVGARLQKAENPPEWSDGFKAGKETNEFLVKAARLRADSANAQVQALQAALEKYGKHPATCPLGVGIGLYRPTADAVCDCGIGAALASAPPAEPESDAVNDDRTDMRPKQVLVRRPVVQTIRRGTPGPFNPDHVHELNDGPCAECAEPADKET